MIDFSLPPETQLLVNTVRKLVETDIQPFEAEAERIAAIPPGLEQVRRKARDLGLFAMGMPEDVGGGGLGHVDSCLVEEQMGRASSALSRYVFGQVYPILLNCAGEQRERYLLPSVRGDKTCAIAITEPGAGSDATNARTAAVADGDGYVINGQKHFITDGDVADYVILMASTDRSKGVRGGFTAFLVDRNTPGFRIGRLQRMMGHRSSSQAELFFEDCRVGAGQVLGDVGQGFPLILKSVSRSRLVTVAARAIGSAARLLEMARRYAGERVQFGSPIGDFQMIQAMLADSATDIYAARCMMLEAAWRLDQGQEARREVSMVKLFASEMAGRVADRALQIFGGLGYSTDLPVERLYRDLRVARIWEGTSEVQRVQIAKSVLARGLD